MGSVVSESLSRPVKSLDSKVDVEVEQALALSDIRALARSIMDKEPSEIRSLLRNDPDLVHGWVSLLKSPEFQSTGKIAAIHDALDHIRLSTLSPLKFAAE